MKKHNTIKVVLITLVVFLLLTWIFPAASYSGEFIDRGRIQIGFFDLFNYPVTVLSYFGYIAFYLLAIGAFYGVLNKIPAYRTFLDKVAGMFKGTEKFGLIIIMLLLAVLTSIGGFQIALLALFPFLAAVILLMGFDKIVVALTLVGSTMLGIAGTTYGYDNTYLLNTVLSVDITSELITKVVILVLGLILLIVNTLLYIKKVSAKAKSEKKEIKKTTVKVEKTTKTTSKKNTKAAKKEDEVVIVKEEVKEEVKEKYDSDIVPESTKGKHSIWPFVVAFSILFVVMVLAFMPWSNSFGLDLFEKAKTSVQEFTIFGFPIFGKLLGSTVFNAFGAWTIIDYIFALGFMLLFLTLVYSVKFDEFLDGVEEGIKKALPLAVIAIILYTCLVINTYHPFQLTIYKAIIGGVSKLNVFSALGMVLTGMLSGLFNVDSLYAIQSVVPYVAALITDTTANSIVAVIYQSIYGFTMLFAPTSLVLMLTLSYLGVSYGKWMKTIWKFLLEFLAVLLIIFLILILL